MSKVIGLTGPTGSGKSTLSAVAEACGFRVLNCDLIARRAVEPGMPGLAAVTAAFGQDILEKDGRLNRKALAAKAFSSPEQTERLNRTLLPHIVRMVKAEAVGQDTLLDAPTLFESGIDRMCQTTIALLAKEEIRLHRIMLRDGLSEEEALLRVRAGKPDAYYIERADHILFNNGDLAVLQKQFRQIIAE